MAETRTQPFELPSGATVEFETVLERGGGARDVAPVEKVPIPFETVVQPLGEVAELVFDALKSTVKTPDRIEVELGAALKGQTRLLIVGGDVQATIKVRLSWNNSP